MCTEGAPQGPDSPTTTAAATRAHLEAIAVGPAKATAATIGSPIPGAPTGAGVTGDGGHESDELSLPDDEDRDEEAMVGGSGASLASASAATSEAALSAPPSPHYNERPASASPLLHPHAHPTHPQPQPQRLQSQPSQRRAGQAAPRKAISSHIAGTGTFMVMYHDQPPLTGESQHATRPMGDAQLSW
jgi:hypothetical protein